MLSFILETDIMSDKIVNRVIRFHIVKLSMKPTYTINTKQSRQVKLLCK